MKTSALVAALAFSAPASALVAPAAPVRHATALAARQPITGGNWKMNPTSLDDTRELAKDMFQLIDADSSGEITVHEMHAVVSDLLGLDLSVEDVFNVVQDIDEDGNGELDLEEFEVLLERFGIFEDFMHVASS